MFIILIGIVAIIAILLQIAMNKISEKINYSYNKKWGIGAVIINVILWIIAFNLYGNIAEFEFWIFAITSTILVTISVIDFIYYEIPNEYNLAIFILGITYMVYRIIALSNVWWIFIAGGVVNFIIYLLLMIVSAGNLGGGDLKLATCLGIMITLGRLMAFTMYTFLSGAVISIFLLVFKVKSKKDKIAFGPYIALSAILIFLQIL
ncbi:MAG: hofD [Clostridiaceae bacterium]|nr:hofD [Clostridiaceae bacterium]